MEDKDNALQIIMLANEIIKFAHEISSKDDVAKNKLKLSADQNLTSMLRDGFSDAHLMMKADSIGKIRKKRDEVFGEDGLFSDPCWDILLDLFSSHLKGKNISVTSACLAANIPATTALRWMNVLEESGLVERKRDPTDARRSFVQVTDNAIVKLTKVLEKYP